MRRGRPYWRVSVQAHTLGRCSIPESVEAVYGPSAPHARLEAVRRVHVREGVPCLRSLMRVSYRFTAAARVESELMLSGA